MGKGPMRCAFNMPIKYESSDRDMFNCEEIQSIPNIQKSSVIVRTLSIYDAAIMIKVLLNSKVQNLRCTKTI